MVGRRRRRGSRGGRGGARNGSTVPAPSPVSATETAEEAPLLVEITPLEVTPANDAPTASRTVAAPESQVPEPVAAAVAELGRAIFDRRRPGGEGRHRCHHGRFSALWRTASDGANAAYDSYGGIPDDPGKRSNWFYQQGGG